MTHDFCVERIEADNAGMSLKVIIMIQKHGWNMTIKMVAKDDDDDVYKWQEYLSKCQHYFCI